jgi:replication factor C small subunit
MITYGLSGEDVIRQIHKQFFELNIPTSEGALIDRTGGRVRIVEGSNDRIQLRRCWPIWSLSNDLHER